MSRAEVFDRNRPLLYSIAYRMMGSIMEAEDVVQRVNGRPGLVGYLGDGNPQSVVSIEVAEGSIRAIRLVVNPEKLRNVPPLERAEREEDSR